MSLESLSLAVTLWKCPILPVRFWNVVGAVVGVRRIVDWEEDCRSDFNVIDFIVFDVDCDLNDDNGELSIEFEVV